MFNCLYRSFPSHRIILQPHPGLLSCRHGSLEPSISCLTNCPTSDIFVHCKEPGGKNYTYSVVCAVVGIPNRVHHLGMPTILWSLLTPPASSERSFLNHYYFKVFTFILTGTPVKPKFCRIWFSINLI